MKIRSECLPCLFERAKLECDLAFGDDDEGKTRAMVDLARFVFEEINSDTVPASIGTERGRIISRASGVLDPYIELKNASNKAGVEALKIAKDFYDGEEDKISALLKIGAAANSMEYGVRGHEFDETKFKNQFKKILGEEVFGDLEEVKKLIRGFSKILYLLDNAGEAVLDRFIVEKLEEFNKHIIVSPKSTPVINDITANEAIGLGFQEKNIVASGSYVGVSLEEAPEEFTNLLFDPQYLILAKGMGNYETLSEFDDKLRGRIVYLFRAKCLSVADSVGVERGTLVITAV
jgi:uncharacterized protein with ATP-grasp and redox domains